MGQAKKLVLRSILFALLSAVLLQGAFAGRPVELVEWSVSTAELEVSPKSFPVIAIHLTHRPQGPNAGARRFEISVGAPVRSVSARELEVTLLRGEEKTLLHTLYVPPEAVGGSEAVVSVRADNGETRELRLKIKSAARFRAKATSEEKRYIRPGEKANYVVKIDNTGNVPLHFTAKPMTSPETGQSKVTPDELEIRAGGSAEVQVEVSTPKDLNNYTALVTMIAFTTREPTETSGDQLVYLHTEIFPEQTSAQLYETLKGSLRVGMGANAGGDRGDEFAFRQQLDLEGLIAEETRLEFHQSYAHPSGENSSVSQALSALPGGSLRNYFRVGVHNPRFDIEAGEVAITPVRLLSPNELGDGMRVAVRPLADKAALQVEAFAERNSLTLTSKDVFGSSASGLVRNSILESWRVGTLSKRGDVGPQGVDWDALGFETGWKIPGPLPLRAELSGAAGASHEGGSGGAWLAGLHYNRALPGEKDLSPLRAGVEFASGDESFPGNQNGRVDRRAYANLRLSSKPFIEAFASFSDSDYKVVPELERTLAEEESFAPDFLLTSQSKLIDGGIRWNPEPKAGGWHLPPGQFQLQESTYFSRSDFFDGATEKTATLTLEPFGHAAPKPGAAQWHLSVLARGGTEDHQNGDAGSSKSDFGTAGVDLTFSRSAPRILEKFGGPGVINFDLSSRFTQNFDNDPQAFNRTGVTFSGGAGWQSKTWTVQTRAAVYAYENEAISSRISLSAERQVSQGWWAGIQAAYTQRGGSHSGGSEPAEAAMMLTFRHDFEIPVPWLPKLGQATGVIFNDLNNNGRLDGGESGMEGVKVGVGSAQTLTGPGGHFAVPAMASGTYPLRVAAPDDAPYTQSAGATTDKVQVTKGKVTALSIGFIKPTACEGQVRLVREQPEGGAAVASTDKADDLSNIELVATDAAGRTHRTFTRADGFFSIYLEPGVYTLQVDPATLKQDQVVEPASLNLTVGRTRIENLALTVTQRVKRIRKTFVAQRP